MKCEKCNCENNKAAKFCKKCDFFLYTNLLKDIVSIGKKYLDKKEYKISKHFFEKALEVTKNTKFEENIQEQLNLISLKSSLEEEKINNLLIQAEEEYQKKNFKATIKLYQSILEYNIMGTLKRKIENKIIVCKAKIYNVEMKDLFSKEAKNPFEEIKL